MQQLVRIVIELGSDLNLDVTLHRIVTAATELTDARYGVLGIRGPDGDLVSFIHEGLDEDTARRLTDLPIGTKVIHVDDLTAPRPQRPAFLGIPISVRGTDFGDLYLVDDRSGRGFSDSQQAAARALASAAAVAIDNARLFEREHASAKWARASREIMTALLSSDVQTQPLQLIVSRALELAEAEQAILLVPSEPYQTPDEVDALVVAATAGRYAAQVIGQQVPMANSTTGGVARRGTPLITNSFQYPIEGFTDVGARSAIVMPLHANGIVLGVIAVARSEHQRPFGDDYLELVSDFAQHAAVALALAAGREHALSHQLAQAETVDEAICAAIEELCRLWRARRVLAITFAAPAAPGSATGPTTGAPRLVSVGESARWDELSAEVRQTLGALRESDLLTPYTAKLGAAGVALQHPEGVLVVWIELAEERPFTLEDQTLLTVLAGRLGQALHRVHQVDQQRETALALQHAILGPAQPPPGIAVRYQAASPPLQVGGDWYDIVDLEDGRIALIVGDCVGHGLDAATVMGQLRSACRALLLDNPSPSAALAGLDRFAARLPGAQCTTVVCVILDPATGELVYSSAGHPPSILVHADGTSRLLDDGHTIPLGVRPNRPRPEAHLTMPARATLLLYTDGLVERRRRALDEGIGHASSIVQDGRGSELNELADQIMSRLEPAGGYHDDVALLLYRQPVPLEFDIPADVNHLASARAAVRNWLTRAGVGPDPGQNMLVATGEAITNAIEHGHRDNQEGTIKLRLTALADRIQAIITDTGSWKHPQPTTNLHRGRGIPLMRALMHDVSIQAETTGTVVHLTAKIS